MRGLGLGLGLGGLAGGAFAAWKFNIYRWPRQLSWALRAGAVGAVLALGGSSGPMLWLAALVSGASGGALMVILTTGLRSTIGTGHLGAVLGWGIGLAAGVGTMAELWGVTARTQTIGATFLVAAVSVLSPFLSAQEPSSLHRGGYAQAGVWRWLGALTILGLLESALFHGTQGGAGPAHSGVVLALMGVGQLAVAVGTGRWLDWGGRWTVMGAALLVISLGFWGSGIVGGLAHAAGLSIYGTVLVYYPARSGRAWLAWSVFALAGPVGSALGLALRS